MLKKHSIATLWFFTYRRHALHEVSPVLGRRGLLLGHAAAVALLLIIWRSQHPGGGAVEEEARLVVVDTGGMNHRGSGHQQADGGRQRHAMI